MSATDNAPGDLSERIIACVRAAEKPIAFGKLLKAANATKAEAEFLDALTSATNGGQVHRWPDYRKVHYFWHASADEKAREAVLAVAAVQALSKTGLSKAAVKQVQGFPHKSMDLMISAIIAEKHLKAVPAFASNSKLFVLPNDSQAYFNAGRSFIEAKIRKADFDPAAFFIGNSSAHDKLAVVPEAAADLILEAVRKLEPVPGVPVPTLRLRNYLPNIAKSEFDAGALELRRRQEVFLSLHADHYNISETEKDFLIDGGDGTYYVGVALR